MAVEETWTLPTGWGQWATWNGAPDAEMRAPTKWMGRKRQEKSLERTAVPGVSDGGIDSEILIHGQQNFRFHFQRLPLCFCWMKTMKSCLNAGKWVGRFLKNSRKPRAGARAIDGQLDSFGANLRSIAWTNRFGVKRLLIEQSKGYRLVYNSIELFNKLVGKNRGKSGSFFWRKCLISPIFPL